MMYTFKVIADLESLALLQAAGLLWYRSKYDPTYQLLPTSDFDYKAWWHRLVPERITILEDGKFCWTDGDWYQHAIRVECDSTTERSEEH